MNTKIGMPFPKGCKKIPKPAFRFFASVFIISGALAGCSATNPNIRQSYDPSADARVRIFVYSADRIRLDFDRRCYGNPGLFGHGDGLETIQRFHDFQGSRSVGMPPTAKRSEAVFDEFIIEAGIPVTVLWQFGGTFGSPFTGVSRHSYETKHAAYFIPVAGRDYEIYGAIRKGIVEDISVTEGADLERFVELNPAEACSIQKLSAGL